MANAISLEIARGQRKVQAYTTFIMPAIDEQPWPACVSNDHTSSVARWMGNTRQENRDLNPQALPIQAWMVYQLRFLITAEIFGDLPTCGGLDAGLYRLSIVLNLATAESIDVAFAYDRLVKLHLEENARARAETALGDGFFDAFLSIGHASFSTHVIAECPPPPTGCPESCYACSEGSSSS